MASLLQGTGLCGGEPSEERFPSRAPSSPKAFDWRGGDTSGVFFLLMVYTALSALRKVKLFRGGLRRRDSLFIVLSTFLSIQRNSRSRPPCQSKFCGRGASRSGRSGGGAFSRSSLSRAFILPLQATLTALFEQIEEQIRRVALAGEGDHRGDDLGFVAGFLVQRVAVAVEYGSLNLAVLAAHIVDVGR